jgi:hypothetical protein
MTHFHFFFFDAVGNAKDSAVGDHACETGAITEAQRRLFACDALEAVEIWRGATLVQSLKRDGEIWMPQPLGAALNLHPLFA